MEKILESPYRTIPGRNRVHPQQLHDAYRQCLAETDRRAQEAHRTEHQFPAVGPRPPAVEGAGSIFQGSGCLYGGPASAQRVPGPGPLVERTGGGRRGAARVTEPVPVLPPENLGRQAQRNSMWAPACPTLILWAVTRNRKATDTTGFTGSRRAGFGYRGTAVWLNLSRQMYGWLYGRRWTPSQA